MPSLYTTIGPWTFQTFTLLLALAVMIGGAFGLRRAATPGAVVDIYLVTLVGGVAGARVFHVLLNWDYFAENLNEAPNVTLGGLDWHGAVIGGLVGLWVGMKIRAWVVKGRGRDHFRDLLDPLTLALPLIGLAGWWGCMAALCGYGLEVDNLSNYPAFAVSETADVYGIAAPRYNTQVFGLLLCGGVLIFTLMLLWRGWLGYRRFWLTLALLSAGMFVIGFFRGDHVLMVGGLRGDQVLDIVLLALAVVMSVRQPGSTDD